MWQLRTHGHSSLKESATLPFELSPQKSCARAKARAPTGGQILVSSARVLPNSDWVWLTFVLNSETAADARTWLR